VDNCKESAEFAVMTPTQREKTPLQSHLIQLSEDSDGKVDKMAFLNEEKLTG
jgi:hypothetical protein